MSLSSKGINMEANSSCAKNIPSKNHPPKSRRQSETGFTDPAEENSSLLLLWFHFITIMQTLEDLSSTTESSFSIHFGDRIDKPAIKPGMNIGHPDECRSSRLFFSLYFIFQKTKVVFFFYISIITTTVHIDNRSQGKVWVDGPEEKKKR